MAQLVFVHGVSTRDTSEYRAAIANRNKLFRELLFTGHDVKIHSPMWGQFVPTIPIDVFKTDAGVGTYSLNVGVTPREPAGATSEISIGAVGKQDPIAALDAICSEIVDKAVSKSRELETQELQVFCRASELIASDAARTVFDGDASDQTIMDQLTSGEVQAFGIGSRISAAVSAVTDRVRNAASTLGFGAIRDSFSPAIGLFIGDVFVYLREGEYRQKIRSEVGKALSMAHEEAKAGKGGPLVVVGHSMGGVILVDMLTNPDSADLPDGIEVDALLTVGSQPGFFAALDLLAHTPSAGLVRRKPDCVKHWLNVFDPIDPLAFRTDMIFKDAVDLAFNSMAGITEVHSKYFQRPQFYARARQRLQSLGVL